ncbi:MAG: sigma-70 family RNA polymerase sigma factor [Pirellulales bacterium]
MPATSYSSGMPDDPFAADIAAARNGCEQALNRLFTACRPYLLLVANQTLPTELRAKLGGSDLVQETLLQVKRTFVHFRGSTEAELIAWLRGALLNNLNAEHRRFRGTLKRNLAREVSLDQGLSGAEHEGLVDGAARSPASQILAAEEAVRLNAALARLPEDYRRVIELRNWEGRPFAEIGELMGRTSDAARKLWARAIEQLKDELQRP